MKLNEIALNINESEYRKLPALSYSTISRFSKEGFKSLDTLFDPISSPSLIFGSMVDALLTESVEAYKNKFIALSLPEIGESVKAVINDIYNTTQEQGIMDMMEDLDDTIILASCNKCDYQSRWKEETRVAKIREIASTYYNCLITNKDKTIVTLEEEDKALRCAYTMKNHPIGKHFFLQPEEDHIDLYHQLKFKATLNNVEFKCMIDAVVVNNKDKKIYLADLKTTGSPEYEFAHSFLKYNYHMQARLYTAIFKECIKGSEYENYIIAPYTFLVINKDNLCPLAYYFELNDIRGNIEIGKNIYKDPIDIGVELHNYLENHPRVPQNIEQFKFNNLCNILKELL